MLKLFTANRGNEIKWIPRTQIDDPDFADDLAVLSHAQRQMQEKTSTAEGNSAHISLKVHMGKNKVFKNKAAFSTTPTTLDGDALEEERSFTYACSVVDKQGRTDTDVKVRIGRARANVAINIKIRIFITTVKH